MADHNGWGSREKATQLLTILQDKLPTSYTVSQARGAYEDIVGALKGRYRSQQLVAAFRSQVEARTQLRGMPLQELAAAVEHLVHQALIRLPEDFIWREADYVFTDEIKDREWKQQLLICSERSLNNTLNQALELQDAKVGSQPEAKV
jgi:hypothetical protein